MTAEVTAEVYGRYTKPEIEERSTNNYRKSDKTDSHTFDLSNAFIVLRIYCMSQYDIYPSLFHHLSWPKKATIVNIFGNFYGNVLLTA